MKLPDFRKVLAKPQTGLIDQTLQRQIDVSQLTTRCRMTTTMCLVGAIVGATYFASFTPAQRTWPLMAGSLAVLAVYLCLLFASQTWLNAANKEATYVASMRRIIGWQVMLGVSWSITMVAAVQVADHDQRRMLDALAIALISTTMVSGPAKYSFAFWVPITIGAFLTYETDPGSHYTPILIALVCYTFLSAYSILMMNRRIVEQELATYKIKRNADTIDLLLKDFQDGSGSFLWETDAALRITEFAGSRRLFGDLNLEQTRAHLIELLHALVPSQPDATSGAADNIKLIAEHAAARAPFKDVIIKHEGENGTRWWAVSGKPVLDGAGQFCGYHGLWADVTEREQSRAALEAAATRDYLTQLYNRAAFNTHLAAACRNNADDGAGLLCLDLDYFKLVNDNFGHTIGDALLVAVAERLQASVRPTDLVFRLGGDEFAILVTGGDAELIAAIGKRVVDHLCKPFQIEGATLSIGASVGIAMITCDNADPDELHHRADMALYRSKLNGRCRYTIYDDRLEDPFALTQLGNAE